MASFRREGIAYEDRADCSACRKLPAQTLWRHRAGRLLFDGRTRGTGPRGDTLCKRRLQNKCRTRSLHADGATAESSGQRCNPLLMLEQVRRRADEFDVTAETIEAVAAKFRGVAQMVKLA